MTADRHSRSRLAGYSQSILESSTVVVVGCGALGQNVILNLALAGVGQLRLVDFDVFEDHNLTRSPLYPGAAYVAEYGAEKAPGVGMSVHRLMTAGRPVVASYCAAVQDVPLQVLSTADVVVSAVDSNDGRTWLARQTRLTGRPLVEGGFEAARFRVTSWGASADRACLSCYAPDPEPATSCSRAARQLVGTGILPALQTTSAVAGGIAAEQVIDHLHSAPHQRSELTFGDIRDRSMTTSIVTRMQDCGTGHFTAVQRRVTSVPTTWPEVADLLAGGTLLLGSPIVLSAQCPCCGNWCRPNRALHRWDAAPYCADCVRGGISIARGYEAVDVVDTVEASRLASRMREVPVQACGIVPGGAVASRRPDGTVVLSLLPGAPAPTEQFE